MTNPGQCGVLSYKVQQLRRCGAAKALLGYSKSHPAKLRGRLLFYRMTQESSARGCVDLYYTWESTELGGSTEQARSTR